MWILLGMSSGTDHHLFQVTQQHPGAPSWVTELSLVHPHLDIALCGCARSLLREDPLLAGAWGKTGRKKMQIAAIGEINEGFFGRPKQGVK